MSANRLFLVCSAHPQIEEALCLAERAGNDVQYLASNMKRVDDWYLKHQHCMPGCDHFQLALNRTADWDCSPPARNTTAGAVRLALVSSR